MIEAKDILSMNFYSYGKPFTGSYEGMRYRIVMKKREPAGEGAEGADPEKYFETAVWPEPYGYEATEPEKIIRKEIPFTEEGYAELVRYLNEKHAEFGKTTV